VGSAAAPWPAIQHGWEAGSGVEALQVWQRNPGRIDLVLTDMVMPQGMSGMELARKLVAAQPKLKVIIASGYTVDDLDTEFLREGGALPSEPDQPPETDPLGRSFPPTNRAPVY